MLHLLSKISAFGQPIPKPKHSIPFTHVPYIHNHVNHETPSTLVLNNPVPAVSHARARLPAIVLNRTT